MKLKGKTINRKDRQLGRRILRWATTGMNYAKNEDLRAFILKAQKMLGDPLAEARVGKTLRGLETITQSAAYAAIQG